jgi:hypothetical protein
METEKHSISTGTCCGHNRIIGGAGVTVFGCISLKCKLDLYVLDGTLTGQMHLDQIMCLILTVYVNARPHI